MKLYKFVGLDSTYGPKSCAEILRSSRFWASSFSELNDPFEFRFIQSDQSKQEELKSFFDSFSHGVVSFSTSNQDLLMWSHYGSCRPGVEKHGIKLVLNEYMAAGTGRLRSPGMLPIAHGDE